MPSAAYIEILDPGRYDILFFFLTSDQLLISILDQDSPRFTYNKVNHVITSSDVFKLFQPMTGHFTNNVTNALCYWLVNIDASVTRFLFFS